MAASDSVVWYINVNGHRLDIPWEGLHLCPASFTLPSQLIGQLLQLMQHALWWCILFILSAADGALPRFATYTSVQELFRRRRQSANGRVYKSQCK